MTLNKLVDYDFKIEEIKTILHPMVIPLIKLNIMLILKIIYYIITLKISERIAMYDKKLSKTTFTFGIIYQKKEQVIQQKISKV
jgi:hypothetical protein